MKGLGRWGDALAGLSSTNEAHCLGSPTNLLDELSKPVCTRCWKLDGAEMSIFFFFFENIFDFKLERKFCLVLLLSPEMKLFSEEILKRFVKKFISRNFLFSNPGNVSKSKFLNAFLSEKML